MTPLYLVRGLLRRPSFGAGTAALITFVVFAIEAPHFVTPLSLATILQLSAELGILSVGVTLLMITAEYDLSIGSVASVSALLMASLSKAHWPIEVAVVLVLLAAMSIGLINGLFVTLAGAPSLIVTLGAMFFWQGVVLIVTEAYPVPLVGYHVLQTLFATTYNHFSIAIVWWLLALAVFSFVLWRTPFGNQIFATGGDPNAARSLGVPVTRIKILMFVLTASLAAIVGMFELTRFGSSDATIGQGIELTAIAATVIGGTQLAGGFGTLLGSTFGVLTLGMIEVGLQLATVPPYFFQGFVGVILLAAVLVNIYTSRFARAGG